MRFLLPCLVILLAEGAKAEERDFTLHVPDALQETGIVQYIVPRFSLKNGIRITVTETPGDAAFGADGTPVFRQGETVWHFSSSDGHGTKAFLDWLTSDIGRRTIDGFAPDVVARFTSDVSAPEQVDETNFEGDVALGNTLSHQLCGRCHVVSEKNRMNAIGSSPSFAVMRTFPDWEGRFLSFFVLKPHPAFTQVEGLTEPFAEHLPSPIAPVEVTMGDIEAITAFVGSIEPADLGAPIKSQ